ncbi:putative Bro-N domain-containing protein 21 [Diachasmimorpha longicaudata entomopoxvirus]|uniref:Putative Bro-N domain-containing protein 21 n=1 Tax=Diachasmimorpha longicaudata entomopoxvirus TaxID=109981 RepID=A0A7R5WDB4_9POXV|nr:putative Bro-N domain-containing protein 21 [Diachasmimorpha longicaudata entomopoxvirus]AKS26472.1 putative Bro-N domain-containing protein 21 [Diachasmimorpha longicaudata entomopoxvirus]
MGSPITIRTIVTPRDVYFNAYHVLNVLGFYKKSHIKLFLAQKITSRHKITLATILKVNPWLTKSTDTPKTKEELEMVYVTECGVFRILRQVSNPYVLPLQDFILDFLKTVYLKHSKMRITNKEQEKPSNMLIQKTRRNFFARILNYTK